MQGFSSNQAFIPQPNTQYRIVSVLDNSKALTISSSNLIINPFTNDPSQRFTIIAQGNKFAFVVQSSSTALCIYQDNSQNGGQVLVDPGQHNSSWFQIERVNSGQYANQGYAIKTFAQGKCLAIYGGIANNGTNVVQWSWETSANEIWLIVPADQPLNQNQGFGGNNQNQGWGNNNMNQGFGINQNQGFGGNNQGFNYNPNQQNQGFGGNNQGFGGQQGSFKNNVSYAFISCGNESKCIQIDFDNTAKIGEFQNAPNQKFIFDYDQTQKQYRIRSASNGQFLSADNIFAGTPITTKKQCDFGQLWKVQPSNNNAFSKGPAFSFKSYTGHAIDVPNNNFNNGTKLEKHGFHGGANQTWYVIEKY